MDDNYKTKVARGDDDLFHRLLDKNRESDKPKTPILFFIDKTLTDEDVVAVATLVNMIIEAVEV